MAKAFTKEMIKSFNPMELNDKDLRIITKQADGVVLIAGKDLITGDVYIISVQTKLGVICNNDDEPINKIEVMQALQRLYLEDQHCSEECEGCMYETVCIKLTTMLEELFGH